MPYQYLWAVGEAWKSRVEGERLGDRYRWVHSSLWLDLYPEQPPEVLVELPPEVLPYLRLSGYARHIPKPYTVLTELNHQALDSPVVLLDQAAIAPSPVLDAQPPQLLPTLAQRWSAAPPLMQLNMLWQIASLWEPLRAEGVASTLLTPNLIRLDGSTVRLLELQPDTAQVPTLQALGQQWQALLPKAHGAVTPFLQRLNEHLQTETYGTSEQLLVSLEKALKICGMGQINQVAIATATDQGPTRKRNEDACFPASGSVADYPNIGPNFGAPLQNVATVSAPPMPLVIVCDGIGGHEGGDVASKLAIESLQIALAPVLKAFNPDPAAIASALFEAVCRANDNISERNDIEQRQAQGRMGTTVVAALVVAESLYLAHLGDSRAYRITAQSCRQITVDDDVASRETRLGYSLYREALYHPGAGSLVQALGMTSSDLLYPTVQRFILDEDALILLCSDGLSDNDLIEQTWVQSLLPVFDHQQLLKNGANDLIQLANTHNGHDNVTVGLLRVSVVRSSAQTVDETAAPSEAPPPVMPNRVEAYPPQKPAPPAPTPPPKTAADPAARPKPWGLIMAGFMGVSAIAGIIIYSVLPELMPGGPLQLARPIQPLMPQFRLPSWLNSEAALALSIDDILQINAAAVDLNGVNQPLLLYQIPPDSLDPAPIEGRLIAGSVLQVVEQRQGDDQQRWVRLRVCSVPSGDSLGDRPAESDTPTAEVNPVAPGNLVQLAQPDSQGWINLEVLEQVVRLLENSTLNQRGNCQS
ncbi:MAG: protein phosphatase 2C domain-containing protein [Cyanobacteria bacterium P01_H01_bin.119]